MSEPIIVALDRPDHHVQVARLATGLARLLCESLILTNVIAKGGRSLIAHARIAESREYRREFESAGNLIPADIEYSLELPEAETVGAGLEMLASDAGAGLIVLGASMGTVGGRVIGGGVGLALLRRTPCAVLMAPRSHDVIGAGHPLQFTSIAVGWDRSPEAADAMLVAIDLAARAGCPLTMLHVLEGCCASPDSDPADGVSRCARAETDMTAAARAVDGDVRIVLAVCEGGAADRLRVASSRLDLLVVGSRRVGVQQDLPGLSVSEQLLHQARCPLLVIPIGARFPLVPWAASSTADTHAVA